MSPRTFGLAPLTALALAVPAHAAPPGGSTDYGVFSMGDGAAAGFGAVGGVGQARWAEDWSNLTSTPSERRRQDWFTRLKHVKLTDKGDVWISFSGEERLRYIFENQPVIGTAALPTATPGKLQAGSTRRDNVGAKLWGTAGPFGVNLTGAFQGGQFRPASEAQPTRAVRAYAVNTAITYNRRDLAGRPSIGIQADLFSGGSYRSKDGAVGTFATPYFPLPYYNDVTLSLTSQNLVGAGPIMDFAPARNLHFKLHVPLFWRDSTNDAVYAVGKTYSWRDNLSGGFIGTIPQAQGSWNFAPHWTWTEDLAGLVASHGMHRAGAKNDVFIMQTLAFRF